MLIEQIIEFKLKRPGPFDRTCTPKTDYFHDKTKIFNANLRMNYYSLLKMLQKALYFAFPIWAKSLTKLNQKMLNLKRVLDLTCK